MVTKASPIDADLLRLRSEFLMQQTLRLTAPQVARLLGVRLEHALDMLSTLEAEGWLVHSPGGQFHRRALCA
jgi:hypothetical protein